MITNKCLLHLYHLLLHLVSVRIIILEVFIGRRFLCIQKLIKVL